MQPRVCPVRGATVVLSMNIASVGRHAGGLRVLHFYVLILPGFYIINFFVMSAFA